MPLERLIKKQIMDLLVLSLEDAATVEDMQMLRAILDRSDEARDYYIQAVVEAQNIRDIDWEVETSEDLMNSSDILNYELWKAFAEQETIAPTVEIPKEEIEHEIIQKVEYPLQERKKLSKLTILSLITSAAAVLVLASYIYFVPVKHSVPVASITEMINAVWADTEKVSGTRLWDDETEHSLLHGVAEITFDSGAKVLIEAPASLKILSDSGMFFQGKLTAEVPSSAIGFTVHTPSSKVVDLGTRFGVIASVKAGTEVHVDQGKIEHIPTSESLKSLSRHIIEAGQAGRISEEDGLSTIVCRRERFLWDKPTAYETAVFSTNPVSHYRFDDGVDKIAFDAIDRTVTQSESFGDVKLAQGKTVDTEHESKALHLAGNMESKFFIRDKTIEVTKGDALTISLWIRPEQMIDGGQNVLVYTDHLRQTDRYYSNQIFLTGDNHVGFYFYQHQTVDESALDISMESNISISLNQWCHVAVSYGKGAVNLYVNGKLHASQTYQLPPQFFNGGYWAVGCKTGHETGHPNNWENLPFRGSVDEMLFFDRSLSDQEIKMLYEKAVKRER